MTEGQEWTIPNLVTFDQWLFLKHHGRLTEGFSKFQAEDIDEICVYYDEDKNFLDYLERRKVEDLTPAFVLLPRFFWETHKDTIPEEFKNGLDMQGRLDELNQSYRDYWVSLQNNAVSGNHPLVCNAVPRPEQEEPLAFLLDRIQEKHSLRGVLQAAPGAGKTFMSIKFISSIRAKALIVVPNEVLADQWVEAITQFTDIKKEEIGMIQGSDLDKIEPEVDKKVSIVKIQSLYSQIKRNPIHVLQGLYRYMDLIIYDECHNSGAATSYAKTSSIFMTPNVLGLSATPYRVGLNDYLLRTSIGETIYAMQHQNLVPDVEIHNVYIEFSPGELNRLRTIGQDYIMYLGMLGAMMKTKKIYFEYLADVVAWNFSQGHNIVVLFPTIALMENLKEQVVLRHPHLTEEILLLKGKTKTDSLEMVKIERKILMEEYKQFKIEKDQRVKNKELKRKDANVIIKERRAEIDQKIAYLKEHALDLYKEKVRKAGIITSNYNLLSAGFDKPQLSNIIFGGPPRVGKISVIQSLGRVTRILEGKNKPLAQYFIPGIFFDAHKSTGIILNKNIKVQYPEAQFKYFGFKKEAI